NSFTRMLSTMLVSLFSMQLCGQGDGGAMTDDKLGNLLVQADNSLKNNDIEKGLSMLQEARPLVTNNVSSKANYYWLYAELLYKQKKYGEMEAKTDTLLSLV